MSFVQRHRVSAAVAAGAFVFSALAFAQAPASPAGRGGAPQGGQQRPARKQLLVWCDNNGGGGYHDSMNRAMAVIQQMGVDTGLYDAHLRTDSHLITKQPIVVRADGRDWTNTRNLDYFDAIFFCGMREIPITLQQAADLLSFVKEDGKGFVAAHAANNAFMSYPPYADMIGAGADNYPWGTTTEVTIINEDPSFPATKHFPATFKVKDEMYQLNAPYARDKVRVVLRLDTSSVDMTNPNVHRKDGDFPQAWAKTYGKGRVFVCAFGQTTESWDDPGMKTMWLESIKWALKLTDADVTPRPMPAAGAPK